MNTKITSKNKYKRSINDIVDNFKKTGKYSVGFLRDLKEGLFDLQKSKVLNCQV